MIFISFPEPDTESWKRWRAQCGVATQKLVERRRAGEKPKIEELYRDKKMQRVYKRRGPPFHRKCAYCESDVLVAQYGDIEHWRPKGKVTDEHNKMVSIREANGTLRPHPGYYWLAYNWRNLLLSCAICNQKGKGTKFPVEGFRAGAPGTEVDEEPLLLNPTQDDPEEHLQFDVRLGIVARRTRRGKASIDILGLNREELVVARYRCLKAVEDLVERWRATAETPLIQRDIERRMEEIRNGQVPYAAVGRAVLHEADLA